ncbi:hypothetical protein JZ751_000788 [Albula glossodonta]|uniref:Uncharacterized protein n=1 Tax=Albula glossodonta TaxID=121402 RepID=A0A8T2PXB6_9TELE|nr:hypothetical protein JZ751_000788 [Albula glossodonta]
MAEQEKQITAVFCPLHPKRSLGTQEALWFCPAPPHSLTSSGRIRSHLMDLIGNWLSPRPCSSFSFSTTSRSTSHVSFPDPKHVN